jgi:hypothetical protein
MMWSSKQSRKCLKQVGNLLNPLSSKCKRCKYIKGSFDNFEYNRAAPNQWTAFSEPYKTTLPYVFKAWCLILKKFDFTLSSLCHFNPLKPELNPSAQRCLMRYFTGDFASWTVHFVNICVKNQQMQQLFIQFINYLWYLLHVSALHCHPQGASLVPSERCSIEEQSIAYCGWACCV